MRAHLMIADGAHAVGGRLYVLGGGLRAVVSGTPYTVVVIIEVDYLDATATHTYGLELHNADGTVVTMTTPAQEERPVVLPLPPIGTGIPSGHTVGMPLDVMIAVGAPALPLAAGEYRWRLTIDGEADDMWAIRFVVVDPPADATRR